jgi:HlyD family secretion protein
VRRLAILALTLGIAACGAPDDTLHGYAEADYVIASSQDPGMLRTVDVSEGQTVEAGDTLFTLNPERAEANYEAAQATADADAARALAQARDAARAQSQLADATLARSQSLFEEDFVSRARLDQDRATADAARAELRRIEAELANATRADRARAAQAELARAQLSDRRVTAPIAGRIERIYREPGEYVAPGAPVLALLPPANLKLRFFVPQNALSDYAPGTEVRVSCDGCPDEIIAQVIFVAREPQFTPPIIYSTRDRERLVFLVEARPTQPANLRPGQPVDIHLPR